MNSQYVATGKPKITGAIFAADITSTLSLPVNASSTLATDFKELGFASDAGLVNSNTRESADIKDWGGTTVLSIQTSVEDKFKFTLIEATNIETLKTIYGAGNVTGTLAAGIAISVNGGELPKKAWVFDMVLNANTVKRIVLPSAKITEVGDINYTMDGAIGYETTLTAYPDEDGNTHYEYILQSTTTPEPGDGEE